MTLAEFAQVRAVIADEGRDDEEKMIALAAILQGVDEDTILSMPLDKVAPVFELVQGLNAKPLPGRVRKTYLLHDWTLRVSDKTLSVAQWIDFQNYARENFDDHLVDLLSVVLVPEGKSYNEGYDIVALKKDLQMMTVKDALAVCFFFQRKFLKSIRRTLTFLVGLSTMKGKPEERKRCLELRRQISGLLASR